jgi:transposase-like protein
MFGMLSVLAELQRELIVANTRDGLAAARARGRNGGRRPRLTPDQVTTAQRLYDEGDHTVAKIADILGVTRHPLRPPRQNHRRHPPPRHQDCGETGERKVALKALNPRSRPGSDGLGHDLFGHRRQLGQGRVLG